jgi:hypothetical protein
MIKNESGLNLLELIVAIVLMSLVLLGFFSIELFSMHHVISSDKRVKVQNDIAYAVEYMSKYVQMGQGEVNNPPITAYPLLGTQTGFQVRVDLNIPPTPGVFTDDTWVAFYLDGNQLKKNIAGSIEVLSSRICSSFIADQMPQFPSAGFYADITDQGIGVDIGLMGRYIPSSSASLDNPQVCMKTRLVVPSASAQ